MEKDIRLHFKAKDDVKFKKVLRKVELKSKEKGDSFTSMFATSVLDFYQEYGHIEYNRENMLSIYNAIVDYGGFLNLSFASKFKGLAVESQHIIENSPFGRPIKVWF